MTIMKWYIEQSEEVEKGQHTHTQYMANNDIKLCMKNEYNAHIQLGTIKVTILLAEGKRRFG